MSKTAIVAKYMQDIRASYWFLPSSLVLLAILLSFISLHIDRHFNLLPDVWRTTQVDGARSILAVISQSMIGVAGVMFSMTIVAVSFASGNFGPRLIGNFMRDRGNQWSLGILVSTFVYTILILRAVQNQYGPDGQGDAFIPHLSLLMAMGLAALSVFTMIFFVHHIPETINVSNITAHLGRRLKTALEAYGAEHEEPAEEEKFTLPDRTATCEIRLRDCGYIQTWNKNQIGKLAQEHDFVASIERIAGDFVTPHSPVIRIWSDTEIPDDLVEALRDCFALGPIPTEAQNPLFIVDQLVEMIARAMSPGMNDPYTAVNCINWLHVGLGTAAKLEKTSLHPPHGRVQYRRLDFDVLLQASIGKIAPYIRDNAFVTGHARQMLLRLSDETDNAKVSELVTAQADMLGAPS